MSESVLSITIPTVAVNAVLDALVELIRALDKRPSFNSAHEGYSVILEELDELWDEVKKREKDHNALREEAIQVAAMGLRFVMDVCDRRDGHGG